jgi:predicted histidine transporter YuiF (NhaC family)
MLDIFNPVAISVLVLILLSLARVNVILSLLMASTVGGLTAGLSLQQTFEVFLGGLGGQGEAALSYILLGILAVMVSRSGLVLKLIRRVTPLLRGPRALVLFGIAGLACLSQTVIPVHIAFIPILIPPLITVFDRMKVDRRAIATALTFGLKAPWLVIPLGFGLIFQGLVADEMAKYGMSISPGKIPIALIIPAASMVAGLAVAILVTYRKNRVYAEVPTNFTAPSEPDAQEDSLKWHRNDFVVIFGLVTTLVLQVVFGSLVIAALAGVVVIFVLRGERWKDGDLLVDRGIGLMGTIAFVILAASGFANVLTESGAVDDLTRAAIPLIGDSQLLGAIVMMLVGLLVTLGIGSSFGTVPVLAAVFVPICVSLGFSPLATAALIGSASALGDAGSPSSDITLGPTAGLNVDGQHNHIWDTCVPTFLHFNILFFIGGVVASMVL